MFDGNQLGGCQGLEACFLAANRRQLRARVAASCGFLAGAVFGAGWMLGLWWSVGTWP